ncbi:MAG: hypothetical protein AAF228_13610 [Pseudomonadota bacterium]
MVALAAAHPATGKEIHAAIWITALIIGFRNNFLNARPIAEKILPNACPMARNRLLKKNLVEV